VTTVLEVFGSSDEQELRATLSEVNELRRARGLQELGPWWHMHGRRFFRPRRFIRAQSVRPCGEGPSESTP
jgi:hypothetical protein